MHVKVDKEVKHRKRFSTLNLVYSSVCLTVSHDTHNNEAPGPKSSSWRVNFALMSSINLHATTEGYFSEETVCEMQKAHIYLPATYDHLISKWNSGWRRSCHLTRLAGWVELQSLGQTTAYLVSSPIKHVSVCCASRPDWWSPPGV